MHPDKQEKRFKVLGYFIEGPTPTFTDTKLVDDNTFNKYNMSREKIDTFYKDILWFYPIITNYDDYLELIKEIRDKYNNDHQPDYSGISTIRTNSIINNWLSSITSFLNHMEKTLKEREDNKYWQLFHNYTSEQYDKNNSYRFIYGLRNYIQHQAPPIHYNYESRIENGQIIREIQIYCNKDELLKSKNWNKQTHEDIITMKNRIEIEPHITSMMESLFTIISSFSKDEFKYLKEDAVFIKMLIQDIPQGRDRGVYEIIMLENKITNIISYLVRFNIIETIIDEDVNKIIRHVPY